jgi:imidazolonepropionase-like amidohydrolase
VDVAAEVARVTAWGADAVKITVESGPKEFGTNPRMTRAMIVAAVAEADAPVLCHVSDLPELEDCIAAGASAAVHGITPETRLPEDLERRMVEAGFALIPTAAMFEGWVRYPADLSLLDDPWLSETITANERASLSASETVERMAWTDARPVRELGRHIRRFHEAGGLLVAGTDTGNPYRFAGYALHEELAFYVASGLSERKALATATINAAELVGAEDEWGSIRAGLAADLVVLAANPLDAIENTRTIVHVIRAGRDVERSSLPVR